MNLTSKAYRVPLMLLIICLVTTWQIIHHQWLSIGQSLSSLFLPSHELSLTAMAAQLAIVATTLVAILAGGLLGVASTLLQQLIKNPLASDTTLAVGSGGQLALLLVTLFLPMAGLYGSFWVAFVGSFIGMAVVFLLARGSRGNPVVLILAGLVVNILIGAVANLLILLYSDYTLGVRLWGAGAFTQTSWQSSRHLLAMSVGVAVAVIPFYKPLSLMSLDDRTAQSLGVPVVRIRMFAIVLVAGVVAMVTSHLGTLAFVGLGAATLANAGAMMGIYRTLAERLVASFVFGALLLWLTANMAMLVAPHISFLLPAGTISAIFGTPLVIWLILKTAKTRLDDSFPALPARQKSVKIWAFLMGLVVLFVGALFVAPQVNLADGLTIAWGVSDLSKLALIGEYRLPRSLSAMAVGAMLAVAGVLLQTLTKNPMASPEVLGVSSGSAMGVLLAFFVLPMVGMVVSPMWLLGFGALGAGLVLWLILWLMKRVNASFLLLIGVAISALMGVATSLVSLSGNPALQAVLSYLSGSTYHANPNTAWWLTAIALALYGMAVLIVKPLSLMGLGVVVAIGRGLNVVAFQRLTLILIALLSAVATLAVGPLSFVGLMIPHLATALGATALPQKLPLSALLGAALMLVADWVGRYAMFPYEIPAGTIASLVGGGYFAYLMYKMR